MDECVVDGPSRNHTLHSTTYGHPSALLCPCMIENARLNNYLRADVCSSIVVIHVCLTSALCKNFVDYVRSCSIVALLMHDKPANGLITELNLLINEQSQSNPRHGCPPRTQTRSAHIQTEPKPNCIAFCSNQFHPIGFTHGFRSLDPRSCARRPRTRVAQP